jgi:endonuclease YncB( thermonuclease family)
MPVVRRVPSLSIAGGPATVVVAGQTYEPTVVKNESQPVAARVVRVIDGQTLLVFSDGDERKVRLLGIDLAAVEEGETALEEAAKLHLAKLVEGKRVSLSYDGSVARKDEDGVEIAYVHRDQDNSFINLRMIRDGYSLAAKAYAYELSDIFSGQQLRAQKRGVGLWASAGPAEAEG